MNNFCIINYVISTYLNFIFNNVNQIMIHNMYVKNAQIGSWSPNMVMVHSKGRSKSNLYQDLSVMIRSSFFQHAKSELPKQVPEMSKYLETWAP